MVLTIAIDHYNINVSMEGVVFNTKFKKNNI